MSAPAPDAHRLNILEHGGFKVGNSTDYQDTKSKNDRETEPNYECHLEAPFNSSKPKPTLFTEATAEIFCDGAYKRNFSPEPLVKVENINHQAPIRTGISPRADASGTSLTETKGIGEVSIKGEVHFHLLYFCLLCAFLLLFVMDDTFVQKRYRGAESFFLFFLFLFIN